MCPTGTMGAITVAFCRRPAVSNGGVRTAAGMRAIRRDVGDGGLPVHACTWAGGAQSACPTAAGKMGLHSNPLVHPPGIEDAGRIERGLEPLVELAHRRR